MLHQPIHIVLFADIGEVLGGLVGLVMLLLWVIRQVLEAKQQAPPQGRKPVAVPRPQPAGGAAPRAGQQADPLRDQVEEFLRRAGRMEGKPEGALRPQQAEPISEIELVPDERGPLATPRSPLAQETRRAGMPQPVERSQPTQKSAKQRRSKSVQPRKRETLAERAAQREGERARRLAKQTSHLGQRIVAEDRQFDVQLQSRFDHAVGTLAGAATTAPSPTESASTDSPASQIAAMLANPEGVRQAIIMNEILRRPSDRW